MSERDEKFQQAFAEYQMLERAYIIAHSLWEQSIKLAAYRPHLNQSDKLEVRMFSEHAENVRGLLVVALDQAKCNLHEAAGVEEE